MENNQNLNEQLEVLTQKTKYLTDKASKKFGSILYWVILGMAGSIFLGLQALSGGTVIPATLIKPALISSYALIVAPWVSYGITKVSAISSSAKLKQLQKQVNLENVKNNDSVKTVITEETTKNEAKVKQPKVTKTSSATKTLSDGPTL